MVNPERMVIAEARRTYTYLSLFGYRVDAVVANRLLPDEVTDPWFDRWRAAQAEHLATIARGVRPAAGPAGPPGRRRGGRASTGCAASAAEVYRDVDPLAVLHDHEPMRIRKKGDDDYRLSLDLPFAEHDDLDVGRRGDELIVSVGPYRRAILLPDSLRRRQVTGATLRKGRLRVTLWPGVDRPRAPAAAGSDHEPGRSRRRAAARRRSRRPTDPAETATSRDDGRRGGRAPAARRPRDDRRGPHRSSTWSRTWCGDPAAVASVAEVLGTMGQAVARAGGRARDAAGDGPRAAPARTTATTATRLAGPAHRRVLTRAVTGLGVSP